MDETLPKDGPLSIIFFFFTSKNSIKNHNKQKKEENITNYFYWLVISKRIGDVKWVDCEPALNNLYKK